MYFILKSDCEQIQSNITHHWLIFYHHEITELYSFGSRVNIKIAKTDTCTGIVDPDKN